MLESQIDAQRRTLHNWLAYTNQALVDADRKGDYATLLKHVAKMAEQLPEVRRILIVLMNTGVK